MNNNSKQSLIIADLRSNCSYQGISTGHFVPVARMYKHLFEDSFDVKIAGGPVYQKYFNCEDLITLPNNVCGDSFFHKIRILQNSLKLFRYVRGKTLVLQQSSDVTSHLALALLYWGGANVYLIRYSSSGINSLLKKAIYNLCRYKINGVICPNEEVGRSYGRPFCVVPDYIYTGNEINAEKESTNLEYKKYDFCIIGRLAKEKGVIESARWIAKCGLKAIIAGKTQTEDFALEIHKVCRGVDNIELRLGYLSEEEYRRILRESKYALLNYQGEYSIRSSGVVFDTLFSGLPVVGTKCKALLFVEEKKLGFLYNSIEELDSAIEGLMSDSERKKYLENIDGYRFTHQYYKKQLLLFLKCYE